MNVIEVAVVHVDPPGSGGLLDRVTERGLGDPLGGVVSAIVRSPPAARLGRATLLFRRRPRPLLAFVGHLGEDAVARLAGLDQRIARVGPHVRVRGWEQVEEDVAALGARLRDVLGGEQLAGAHLVGVPRGGAVVAGLLGYELGLPAERFGSAAGPTALTLVVDDTAYTGLRLRERIERQPGSLVIGCLWAASATLAYLADHPRVEHAVAARELPDLSEHLLGSDAAAWRARWQTRRGGDEEPLAALPPVVWPWTEPVSSLWNDRTGEDEDGWLLAPPQLCARTRRRSPQLAVVDADTLPGLPLLAPHVLPWENDGRIELIDARAQRRLRLDPASSAVLTRLLQRDPDTATPPDQDGRLAPLLEALGERGLLAT